MKQFDAVTVVWGREFRELFLDVCMPNQSTPGNLGALPAGSRYRIFTSADDATVIEASDVVIRLRQTMPVDLVVVPGLSDGEGSPFARMNACHQLALDDAAMTHTAITRVLVKRGYPVAPNGKQVANHRHGSCQCRA